MKKLLDDAFCKYVLEKKLLDSSLIEQIKEKKNISTVRENLLIKGHLSLASYTSILTFLQSSKNLVDTESSAKYDKKFLEVGIQKKHISQEQVNLCQMQSLSSPVSTRELLLASGAISFQAYSAIMTQIVEPEKSDEVHKVDSSEQTVIDENIEPLSEEDEEETTLSKSQLSLVCDNSAETIIDINPLDSGGKAYLPPDLESSPREGHDSSMATLVDESYVDLDSDEEIPADDPTVNLTGQSVSAPVEEVTFPTFHKELSFPEKKKEAPVKGTKVGHKTKKKEKTTLKMLPEGPSGLLYKDEIPPEVMEGLIRKVQEEVNLQTQRMSKDVAKEISGYKSSYKVLSSVFVFFAMFFLTFTGWIEYQRYQDVKELRQEKNHIVQTLSGLQNEKAQLLQEKNEIVSQKETVAKQAQEKEQKFQADLDALQKNLEQHASKINAIEKDKESLQNEILGSEVRFALVEYYLAENNSSQAMYYLKREPSVTPSSAINIYLKLGGNCFKNKKYDLAKKNWEKVLQLGGSLDPETKKKLESIQNK